MKRNIKNTLFKLFNVKASLTFIQNYYKIRTLIATS